MALVHQIDLQRHQDIDNAGWKRGVRGRTANTSYQRDTETSLPGGRIWGLYLSRGLN